MATSKNRTRTIEEIVEFILENEGPDLERMAHPTKKIVKYGDLESALSEIHERGLLPNLQAFHFKDVRNIWTQDGTLNYPLAREMMGILMEELLERHGSYNGVIRHTSFHQYHDHELSFHTKNGVIKYNLESMFHSVYASSPSAAVIDYLQNHPNISIKKEFGHLRPCHFPMTPPGYWKSPEGQKDARQLIGQGLAEIFKKNGNNWIEAIKSIKDGYFYGRKAYFENKFGRIPINLQSVIASAYDGIHIEAVIDYLKNNDEDQNLRKEFEGLRPYHFAVSPHGTWVNSGRNPYALELTCLMLKDISEERGISILQAIQSIRTTDFHRNLRFSNRYGSMKFSGGKAFESGKVYNHSPTRAVLDWMKNNPDEKIRQEFGNFKLFYFTHVPDETYKGENRAQIGREATAIIMDELLLEHGSYESAVKHIKPAHFKKARIYRNGFGEISYTLDKVFNGVYGRSCIKAVVDYLQNHPDESVRKKFATQLHYSITGALPERLRQIPA